MELVSIVMPAYNAAKYIAASVDSVRAQSFTNWELLIIDDGSTDDTSRIAQSYAAEDCRIRYYRQTNSGVSVARNKAIKCAQGGVHRIFGCGRFVG